MREYKKAQELTKKFIAGALCPVDFKHKRTTMFWPHYEMIAKKMGIKGVTEVVVKKYWFEFHNHVVFKRFQRKELTFNQAYKCMVRLGKKGNRLFCFHGGFSVCPITEQEAVLLDKQTTILKRGSR